MSEDFLDKDIFLPDVSEIYTAPLVPIPTDKEHVIKSNLMSVRKGLNNMYEHLVLFKFNENLTPQKEKQLLEKLKGFKEEIPGIVELTAGINVTEEKTRAQGYTLGLRVTFENKDALDKYGPHPVHQQFVRSLEGVIEDVIVVDYLL